MWSQIAMRPRPVTRTRLASLTTPSAINPPPTRNETLTKPSPLVQLLLIQLPPRPLRRAATSRRRLLNPLAAFLLSGHVSSLELLDRAQVQTAWVEHPRARSDLRDGRAEGLGAEVVLPEANERVNAQTNMEFADASDLPSVCDRRPKLFPK